MPKPNLNARPLTFRPFKVVLRNDRYIFGKFGV